MPRTKAEYVERVTRGEGFMPWQARQQVSDRERRFRDRIEARKTEMLAETMPVDHPTFLTDEDVARARDNARKSAWARNWYNGRVGTAYEIVELGEGWPARMLEKTTPTSSYSFVCPACIGVKSIEGSSEGGIIGWDWREPEILRCKRCGQTYPDPNYPETATLACPRRGQELTFYLNERERANPEDRSGNLSYRWARYQVHPSFAGIIRGYKARFALNASLVLAQAFAFTWEPVFAERARDILLLFTRRFRHDWLYIDYGDGFADCDPLFAAWHWDELPIEWKRHLCTDAYEDDEPDSARMMQHYWGAGRVCPSTGCISALPTACQAYDTTLRAVRRDRSPIWSEDEARTVRRDLMLEWVMEAEPYLGGPGKAGQVNNKSPRLYRAFAAVARCTGISELADVAHRGYVGVRDESFGFDGFSHESPSYNTMYLSTLVTVPETLQGFRWRGSPADGDLFAHDEKLKLMLRAAVEILRSDGTNPTLSDTRQHSAGNIAGQNVLEIALKRYPAELGDAVRALFRQTGTTPSAYAVCKLDAEEFDGNSVFDPPELWFPDWMTAFLRHGSGENTTLLNLTANPPGGHRHDDNLALSYLDSGRRILGDHGYLSASPAQRWIHATESHNLVIVNGEEQLHGGDRLRSPGFGMMLTTPELSAVEAHSHCYTAATEYRRTVVLLKGPGARSVAVDIFHVAGGDTHDWRLFSEIASSTAEDGDRRFDGIHMPPDAPLPDFGASTAMEHVYGLRDENVVHDPPDCWQAIWSERERSYRLWMMAPADRIVASNGPGQETWQDDVGRRVRYIDVIRNGNKLRSTFVALHEPSDPGGRFVVNQAERLPVTAEAGESAVAVRIQSEWGDYLVLSDFEREAEVHGVRFAGKLAVFCRDSDGSRWLVSSGAPCFQSEGFGYRDMVPTWRAEIVAQDDWSVTATSPLPGNWQAAPDGVSAYAVVELEDRTTGFPVAAIDGATVRFERFPLPSRVNTFSIPLVRRLVDGR